MDSIIYFFKYLLILLYYILLAKIVMFIMDKIGEFIGLKKLIQWILDRFFKPNDEFLDSEEAAHDPTRNN